MSYLHTTRVHAASSPTLSTPLPRRPVQLIPAAFAACGPLPPPLGLAVGDTEMET